MKRKWVILGVLALLVVAYTQNWFGLKDLISGTSTSDAPAA